MHPAACPGLAQLIRCHRNRAKGGGRLALHKAKALGQFIRNQIAQRHVVHQHHEAHGVQRAVAGTALGHIAGDDGQLGLEVRAPVQVGTDDVGPRADIVCANLDWGPDFEAELAVITGDVPQGCASDRALDAVRLVVLVNDVTLRNLIPDELAKGFGFVQSKPATAFGPVAVTPDELGEAWARGRVHLPVCLLYTSPSPRD